MIHWGSFIACLCIVLWQVFTGTVRYLSHPIATKTFTDDIIPSHITVCHQVPRFAYALDRYGISVMDYENGQKLNTSIQDADDIFNNSTDKYHYVLDGSGN